MDDMKRRGILTHIVHGITGSARGTSLSTISATGAPILPGLPL